MNTPSLRFTLRLLLTTLAAAALAALPIHAADNFEAAQKAWTQSVKLESSGQYEAAIDAVHRYADSGGDRYLATIRLAWLAYLGKDYAYALECYEAAATARPRAITPLQGLLHTYEANGEPKQAERTAKRLLKADANQYDANLFLGRYHFQLGQFTQALGYLQRLHSLHPEDATVASWLAWTQGRRGNENEARALFELVAVLDPTNELAADALRVTRR